MVELGQLSDELQIKLALAGGIIVHDSIDVSKVPYEELMNILPSNHPVREFIKARTFATRYGHKPPNQTG
jgi:hypothetical protein